MRKQAVYFNQTTINRRIHDGSGFATRSLNATQIGAQKTLIQRTYEINTGQDSLNIDFLGANRQFDWIEISTKYLIVYNKSDKHTSIYDRYNVELAAKTIKSVRISNFTEVYSLTNEKKNLM